MDQHAREAYLEAQVMTATPQKLRLMLIEGAIRFARQTIHHWQADDNESALESIIRCRNIVSELLSSVRVAESTLTQQVASIYLFVFQRLTEAQLRRDAKLVEEAIGVLEVEQGTWRDICDEMPHAPISNAEYIAGGPQEILAPTMAYSDASLSSSSISFDA